MSIGSFLFMVLNAHRHSQLRRTCNMRVFLNNVEVTRDCYYADGRRGVVRLYVRDSAGRHVLTPDRTGILKIEKRGRVKFKRKL